MCWVLLGCALLVGAGGGFVLGILCTRNIGEAFDDMP